MSVTRTRTLTAGAVTRLVVPPGGWNAVAVYNLAGPADVLVTINGVDPVANADNVYTVPIGGRRRIYWSQVTGSDVRLLSTGATKVEVEFA